MPWNDRLARQLKLRDLHVFKVVAHLGSMGKAATELAVSQPAISKAITDLEYVLGVRLLDRSRQGVEPTRYGIALLEWSAAVFDNLRQGVDEIDFLADPTAGELRIGTTEVLTAGLIPAVIDRLSRQYPRIVFSVMQAVDLTQQYRDLRERNVDLILGRIAEPMADEDMDLEILFEDRLCVVAGINSRWHRRRKVDVSELINEPWALPPYDSFIGSLVKEAFLAKGLTPPRMTAMSTSLQLYTGLLATGRFLALRSTSMLRLAGKRSSVKALPVDLPIRPLHIGIVTLKNRTLNPVAQLFIACAREVVRPLAKLN
jgi:DNA-binding transcriptional LysR family regulator